MKSESEIRRCLSNSFWICGSSCAGKSTVCRILSKKYDWTLIDIDHLVDDVFPNMITEQDHPNLTRLQQKGLPWLFGKQTDDFLQFQEAANREYLDLLVIYLSESVSANELVIDGGEIYDPDLLSQYVPTGRSVYLYIPEEMQISIWKSRNWVFDVLRSFDKPDFLFQRWMELDLISSRRMRERCDALGLPCVSRDASTAVENFVKDVE